MIPSNRVAQAFLLAPPFAGLPVGLFLLMFAPKAAGPATLLVALWSYPVALLLALPVYMALRRAWPPTPGRALLVGAAIGVVATDLLLSFAAPELRRGLHLNGRVDWRHLLAAAGACGALAGIVFWAVLNRPSLNRQDRPEAPN